MNDKDWQIIRMIAEEKNMTIAAERLYITQPALSYRLRNIEKEFNTKLFIRTPKGVVLTPQGEGVLHYAKHMLFELEHMKAKINSMEHEIQGTLTLGLSTNFAKHRLSQIMRPFLKAYPQVSFSIKTGLSSQICQLLESEKINIAIIRGDYSWPEARVLISEEPVLLSAHHEIKIDDLPDRAGIMYETDALFQKEISDWWRERFSRPPQYTMHINDADTCRQLISMGLGWSILPAIDNSNAQFPDLYTYQLIRRNGMPLTRRTWMLHRYASMELSPVRAFVDFMTPINNT